MEKNKIVKLLLNTGNKKNILLAKRIINDKEDDHLEQKEIINKVYELFLSLLVLEDKDKLQTLDSIRESLIRNISIASGWSYWPDGAFFLIDADILEVHQVVRTRIEYISLNNREEEIEFINKYSSLLGMIHDNLLEKERLLDNNYRLKNNDNRELSLELLEFIEDYSKELEALEENSKIKKYN